MSPTTETHPTAEAFNRQQLIPMLQYRRRRAEIHGDVETIAVIDLAIAEIERLRADAFDAALELRLNNRRLETLATNQGNAGFQILAADTRMQIERNNVAIAKLHAVVAEECEVVK